MVGAVPIRNVKRRASVAIRHRKLSRVCLWLVACLAGMKYLRLFVGQARRQEIEEVLSQRADKSKYCSLEEGPTPVILVSLGRSGSGVTFQVLTNVTNSRMEGNVEYPGKDADQMKQFFKTHTTEDWLPEFLCMRQDQASSEAQITGFKWKPYSFSARVPGVVHALKWARRQNGLVKVLLLTRNPLDVHIARHKHRQDRDLHAHCKFRKCMKEHLRASTNILLPTNQLVTSLSELIQVTLDARDLLEDLQVPYLPLSYEKLYYANDTSEWLKAFQFIGKGPTTGFTKRQLNDAMITLPTNHPHHNMTLGNYNEIRKMLEQNSLEHLLH